MKDFYDYQNQAWVVGGVYQRCGHPETMDCGCYGKLHAGEPATWQAIEGSEIEAAAAIPLRSGDHSQYCKCRECSGNIRPSLKAAINFAMRGGR